MSSDTARSSHRRAISYIDRSREFYAAHGYETPYEWAVHEEVPFARLTKPVSEARLGVVTTAFPHGEHSPKRAFAESMEPKPTSLFTADLSWHKEATHTDDVETFLPIEALERAVGRGSLGALSPRFYGVPTEYSQRRTGSDAELIRDWCVEDDIDAVLLIPL